MNDLFSAKELRHAADRVEAQILAGLESQPQKHEFSPEFHQKMEALLAQGRREERSRRVLRTVAASLAILIICAFSWLVSSAEARNAVQRWVRDAWRGNIVYRFLGKDSSELPDARPVWLPSGYEETRTVLRKYHLSVTYQNEDGDCIFYDLEFMRDGIELNIIPASGEALFEEKVFVQGLPGVLYLSDSESEQSILIWMDEEAGLYYSICAGQDASVMLHMAESVEMTESAKKEK